MKKYFFLLMVILVSCKPKTEWVKYEDQESGFSISYPKDWHVLTEQETKQSQEKGKKALEKVTGEPILMSHRSLLDVKKNLFTVFNASTQSYDRSADGPYAEIQEYMFSVVRQSFREEGMEFNHTMGKKMIDGLEFTDMSITLYKNREPILFMHLYDRLFDQKLSITISISYNNEREKETLMEMLESAKFKYRN